MDTIITIKRGSSRADRRRRYKVVVDNQYLGSIKDGESKSFAVSPGEHELALKIDWCSSNRVRFNIASNQTVTFDCGSSLVGPKIALALFYVLFAWNRYLWLKQV